MFAPPIEVLRALFEQDNEEKRRERRQVEAKETTERLRRLAREASRFMREKLEDLVPVGDTDVIKDKSFVEKGMALSALVYTDPSR